MTTLGVVSMLRRAESRGSPPHRGVSLIEHEIHLGLRQCGRSALLKRTAMLLLIVFLMLGCNSVDRSADPAIGLSCGSGPRFSAEELIDRTRRGGEPLDSTVASFVSTPEAARAGLPKSGWFLVRSTTSSALFLAPSTLADAPFAMVVLKGSDGRWATETWGGCVPALNSARAAVGSWDLARVPDRASMELEALVTEADCTGGERAGGRVLPPSVEYSESNVVVTFWITPFATSQEAVPCIGAPPTPYVVKLTEPLGGRVLLDGGVLPHRPVVVTAPPRDPGDASPGPPIR